MLDASVSAEASPREADQTIRSAFTMVFAGLLPSLASLYARARTVGNAESTLEWWPPSRFLHRSH